MPLQLDPNDHELHYNLACLQQSMGRPDDARVALNAATQLYRQCPKPHLMLGSLLMSLRRPRAALRHFERAVHLCPDQQDEDAKTASIFAAICGVRLAAAHPSHAPSLLPAAEWRLRRALLDATSQSDREGIEGLLREAEAAAAAAGAVQAVAA